MRRPKVAVGPGVTDLAVAGVRVDARLRPRGLVLVGVLAVELGVAPAVHGEHDARLLGPALVIERLELVLAGLAADRIDIEGAEATRDALPAFADGARALAAEEATVVVVPRNLQAWLAACKILAPSPTSDGRKLLDEASTDASNRPRVPSEELETTAVRERPRAPPQRTGNKKTI